MIAEVIVDVQNKQVDKVFDYSCFDDTKIGSRVIVPFGKKNIEGYVVKIKDKSDILSSKLKSIIKVIDNEILTDEMLKLSNFMIEKYNLKTIDTLKLFLPSIVRQNKVKSLMIKYYKLNENYEQKVNLIKKNAINQQKIVDYLIKNKECLSSLLNEKFSNVAVKKLENSGIITSYLIQKERKPKVYSINDKNIILNDLQTSAVEKITTDKNKTILLYGVTGSGKTEVYMHCINKVIKQNKTAIMLVPEISLTPQVMQNFVARFGDNVAIIHSGLSSGEKFDEWQRIKSGKAKIVVGARSAIFVPLNNIGLIVIDEEHDTSYYSENNPRYFTHEIAKFRANYNNCNLVLGSATPSIEDYYKAKNGEYELINMPLRVNRENMPTLQIVDMLSEIGNGNTTMFSTALLSSLSKTIENNEQAIIFLNRRGYNSFVMCKECGYTAKCEDCDVSLVYHKEDNELKCHYCGKRYHNLSECPSCHSKYIKYGAVGTQKVVEELQNLFPNVKIFRMDNDSTTTKNSHEEILHKFGETKPSILVGTQMIAKGHDFPLVTLVGIIDADLSLHFSDYRANERTFDLITQVAGRAGRSEKEGYVILQTYCPKHYAYRYAQEYNYEKFYEREINLRKTTNFPPFAIVCRILITSEQNEKAHNITKLIYEQIAKIKENNKQDFVYYGVMKSPIKRIKKKYRYQILMRIKPERYTEIIKQIFDITNKNLDSKVSVFVEQNPQNLS